MAKNDSIIGIRGKLDGKIYAKHPKAGNYIKNVVKPGSKKNELPLQTQYRRTAYLNKLAGEINTIAKQNAPKFKASDFYQAVLSRFRGAEQDNRFHLLMELRGLEVNKRYKLGSVLQVAAAVSHDKKKFTADIRVKTSLETKHTEADCYCFEVWFVTWGTGERAPLTNIQFSEWMPMDGTLPEFDFNFTLTKSTVHWIMFVGVQLGEKNKNLDYRDAQAIQIMNAGTLNKKEAEHYVRLYAEKEKVRKEEEKEKMKNNKVEPERVKAKKINPRAVGYIGQGLKL
jgi:hypothetical protein